MSGSCRHQSLMTVPTMNFGFKIATKRPWRRKDPPKKINQFRMSRAVNFPMSTPHNIQSRKKFKTGVKIIQLIQKGLAEIGNFFCKIVAEKFGQFPESA